MSAPLPGKGLFGWLGRQVGHVRKAIHVDPATPARIAPIQGPPPAPLSAPVVYQDQKVEEVEHPTHPGLKLRRTTIDQVIVHTTSADPPKDD